MDSDSQAQLEAKQLEYGQSSHSLVSGDGISDADSVKLTMWTINALVPEHTHTLGTISHAQRSETGHRWINLLRVFHLVCVVPKSIPNKSAGVVVLFCNINKRPLVAYPSHVLNWIYICRSEWVSDSPFKGFRLSYGEGTGCRPRAFWG